jgi:protein-disulfide isomerase
MDKHSQHIGVYGAIAGSLVVSLLGTYLIVQNQQVEQVGGRDNYKIYQKMVSNPKYGDNIKQSLEAQIAQMEWDEAPTPSPSQPSAEPKNTGSLSEDDIAGITKNAYIDGDKDADILWIEYSDLECPFCKRLHDSGAISNLQAKYGDKLAVSFKHYPLPFHPQAVPGAMAAECVGETGGSDKYCKNQIMCWCKQIQICRWCTYVRRIKQIRCQWYSRKRPHQY